MHTSLKLYMYASVTCPVSVSWTWRLSSVIHIQAPAIMSQHGAQQTHTHQQDTRGFCKQPTECKWWSRMCSSITGQANVLKPHDRLNNTRAEVKSVPMGNGQWAQNIGLKMNTTQSTLFMIYWQISCTVRKKAQLSTYEGMIRVCFKQQKEINSCYFRSKWRFSLL